MAIATLIAAGRLDDSLLGAARSALAGVGARADQLTWIDPGDAADLSFEGEPTAVRAALEAIDGLDIAVRAGERVPARLFVADMDSTMIGQECIDELADYAGFKGEVAAITERAMQGELDFASALAARVALLEGLDQSVIGACLRERIRSSPGAKVLVATMKAQGALTVLVSGGFTDFVGPIATQLGFDRFHANVLEVDNGQLSGTTIGPIVDAAAKRRIAGEVLAELGAGAEGLVAVGDGANDAPMVELAGLGVGYRPKPALARIADGVIRHHDLTALLWMQGIARRHWII